MCREELAMCVCLNFKDTRHKISRDVHNPEPVRGPVPGKPGRFRRKLGLFSIFRKLIKNWGYFLFSTLSELELTAADHRHRQQTTWLLPRGDRFLTPQLLRVPPMAARHFTKAGTSQGNTQVKCKLCDKAFAGFSAAAFPRG